MIRSFATLVLAAAAYGFAIGAANSWLYACRNLVKFPLLILTTAAVCALSYFVLARFLGARLTFVVVQRVVLAIFRDASVLLASLAPLTFFLAMTCERPGGQGLGEYPLFQGLNVGAIAVSGALAVVVRARQLQHQHGLGGRRVVLLVGVWLAVTLLVGGQVGWYMRPFFGMSGPASQPPFFNGLVPDFRGARSFYEALYNLVVPPE